jgi:hypothetical protein
MKVIFERFCESIVGFAPGLQVAGIRLEGMPGSLLWVQLL